MNNSHAVVFDLGKVLLDFDFGKAAAGLRQHCQISREEIVKAIDQSPLLHRYETGLITSHEFFAEIKALSRFAGELEHFEPLFSDIFTPIPEMIDLHTRIRTKGIPNYIFSNTSEMVVRHIRATYPFFNAFTGYVFSFQHRAMKPNPAIYAEVERLANRRGGEIVYIDDRLENVEQGRARGWNAIHHTTPKETVRQVKAFGLL